MFVLISATCRNVSGNKNVDTLFYMVLCSVDFCQANVQQEQCVVLLLLVNKLSYEIWAELVWFYVPLDMSWIFGDQDSLHFYIWYCWCCESSGLPLVLKVLKFEACPQVSWNCYICPENAVNNAQSYKNNLFTPHIGILSYLIIGSEACTGVGQSHELAHPKITNLGLS